MSFAAAAATTVDFSSFHLSHSSSSFYLCHSHLGHVLSSHLIFLASIRALRNLKTDISNYSGCKLAKFFALPFNQNIYVSSSPFALIHSDVWGDLLMLPKNKGLDIMLLLLMTILVIVGFI